MDEEDKAEMRHSSKKKKHFEKQIFLRGSFFQTQDT